MFNKKPFAIILLALFSSLGCGSSSSTDTAAPPNQQVTSDSVQKSTAPIPTKAENLLTFDVLGGIFKQSNTASAMTLAKTTLNLPQPQTKEEAVAQFSIDTSYTFLGYKSSGRLVVTAAGAGSEAAMLRHYEPLTLRFLFFNYAFKNDCFGVVHVDGEIRCEIVGDYWTDKKTFSGTAHCVNGPQNKPETVIYITDKKTYDVSFDAQLKIDGDYLNYGSYNYQGDITIDGAKKKIEDLMKGGLSCE